MSSNERLIGVIGAGTMGAGIAQAAATAGFAVATLDTDAGLVRKAYSGIRERLDGQVSKGKLTPGQRDEIAARLRIVDCYNCVKTAECVIEAVPEDLALKRKVFAELDGTVSDRTLLGTNTSCLSVAKIADGLKHADRVVGLHFFNPVPVMKLIELIRAPQTSDQAMVDARAIGAKLQKTLVVVKDSPGFIGNRVNRPFYLEALRLLETGQGDVSGIDEAVKSIGGFKMGPFELLDLIGLDVNLNVTQSIWNDFGKPSRFTPNAIQQKLVAAGRLGRKTGLGFYDYSGSTPVAGYEGKPISTAGWKASAALTEFAKGLGKTADRAMWVYARILTAVMNEAALVADAIALPRDVNLTMELGFNYPEGPLVTADHVGLDIMQRLLAEFYAESAHDERYKPNALLDKHVAAGNLGEQAARGFLYHAL